MIYAYLRVSTDKQDNDKQEFIVLEYAQKNKIIIDEILRVEMSSRKSEEARRITELKNKLQKDDVLITAELSRLGRAMVEVIKLVLELDEKGVKLVFIRQPELSTFDSAHKKFMLAVYAYFCESEREFLSMRTKQGLAAAREKGRMLGRPKGTGGKSQWDKVLPEIIELIHKDIPLHSIWKLTGRIGSYSGFFAWCKKKKEICEALRIIKDTKTSLIALINEKNKERKNDR